MSYQQQRQRPPPPPLSLPPIPHSYPVPVTVPVQPTNSTPYSFYSSPIPSNFSDSPPPFPPPLPQPQSSSLPVYNPNITSSPYKAIPELDSHTPISSVYNNNSNPYQQQQRNPSTPISHYNNHNPILSLNNINNKKRSTKSLLCRCCGCCICILILIIIAIVIFIFLIFKLPNISFGGAQSPQDRPPLTITGTTVKFDWDFIFNVNNPNTFGAQVSTLDVKGYPPNVDRIDTNLIANGTRSDTYIASKSTTTVQFPVTFQWNTQQPTGSQFFINLLNACGAQINNNNNKSSPSTPNGNKIQIQYQVDIGLALLSPFGYKIPTQGTESFNCPINLSSNNVIVSQLIQLVNQLSRRSIDPSTTTSSKLIDKQGQRIGKLSIIS